MDIKKRAKPYRFAQSWHASCYYRANVQGYAHIRFFCLDRNSPSKRRKLFAFLLGPLRTRLFVWGQNKLSIPIRIACKQTNVKKINQLFLGRNSRKLKSEKTQKLQYQLLVGDSAEVLKGIPSNSIDMIIGSPPYSDLRKYQGFQFDFPKIAIQVTRVLKNSGFLVWVVGDKTKNFSEQQTPARQAIHFTDQCQLNLVDTVIWEKDAVGMPDKYRYFQCFEFIYCFCKGKPNLENIHLLRDRPNAEAGKTKTKTTRRGKNDELKLQSPNIINPYGLRRNVMKIGIGWNKSAKDRAAFEHPAIYPTELVKTFVQTYTSPGETILDPFNGSGQTLMGIAELAKEGKGTRNYIGIDISQKYLDLTKRRFTELHGN